MNEGMKETVKKLITWYEANKRDLPWRRDPSPYAVWISEIMLQQTRVAAVIPYYERWMTLFPTVSDLAAASEDAVLKAWEGLGYYTRARNLHAAAKIVAERYGGELPRNEKELSLLPGIGEYTVGAIRSIAFGEKEPAVDGNVLRVYARLTENPSDVSKTTVRATFGDILQQYMEEGKTSSFTQSFFELGALICLPNAPKCEECPLKENCAAYRNKTQDKFPVKSAKREKRREAITVFLIRVGNTVAVRYREGSRLLAGLYEFPYVEGVLSKEEAEKKIGASCRELPPISHVFTHMIWEMRGFEAVLDDPTKIKEKGISFVPIDGLDEKYPFPGSGGNYPISAAFRKFLRLL